MPTSSKDPMDIPPPTQQPRPRVRPERKRRGGWLSRIVGFWGVGVGPAVGLLGLWLALGTTGYVLIEGYTLFEGLYMTVITLSTVGYEEVRPLSEIGRGFTVFLIVAGLGTVFYAFTRIGQLVIEGELAEILGRKRMRNELQALTDHFIVCGYGRTSEPVVAGLAQEDLPFCVIDLDANHAPELAEHGIAHLIGDATEEAALEEAGIRRARGVLALLPSDADNLYLTMSSKGLNPDVRVIARASSPKAEANLRRGGADSVVSPYKTAGNRVLHAAIKPTVVEFMELATPRMNIELTLEEVLVEPESALAGSSLAEGEIRKKCGAIIVAIKRASGEMTFNPHAAEEIHAEDTLIALGEPEDLEKLEALCANPV